mmetsp:Transcript_34329/g.78325  ORF Transcript_34329/g.78325 Transcript_34329/m.78325 type:complete len:401 (-) Transcript_34329:451-1653(-)
MHLGSDDVAFVLGRGGSTKQKIARVAGARLELDDNGRLEIYGRPEAQARAKQYVELVLAQRVGPVYIDFDAGRDDLTAVDVPTDCVGYVTGKNGVVLRSLEEEWGTLMFFAKDKSQSRAESDRETERLAIFGSPRARCGAELKVMSAVEHKSPGFFLDRKGKPRGDILERFDDGDFGITTYPIADDELSYALGKQGSTRKKLARAANCILEYVGHTAFVSGTRAERRCGCDYLEWLIEQRKGPVHVDTKTRDDVTTIDVPSSVVGYLMGYRGVSLRQIEAETGTFIFADGEGPHDKGANRDPDSTECILVFGALKEVRRRAERILQDRMQQKLREDARFGRGGGGRNDRGGGGRRYSRSRSPPRRRRYSRSRSPPRRRSRSRSRSPRRSRSPPRRRSRSR